MCMDQLKDAYNLKDPSDTTKLVEEYFFAMVSKPPVTTQQLITKTTLKKLEKNIKMKLERVFVEVFREKIKMD